MRSFIFTFPSFPGLCMSNTTLHFWDMSYFPKPLYSHYPLRASPHLLGGQARPAVVLLTYFTRDQHTNFSDTQAFLSIVLH